MTGDSARASAALRPVWRQRNFMLLWTGQVVSSLGSGMSSFALPLLILALTGSPLYAGTAAALYALPYPLFSLPVGALMDRWNRKRVMIACDAIRAVNIVTIPIALAAGRLGVWQIFANAFIEGSCFVVFNIAEVAALSRVVHKTQLASAAAQNEAAFGVVGLLSPSIGGVLYKVVGAAFPFVVDAISYAASVVSLSLIRVTFQAERAASTRGLGAEIKEGLAWLWRRRLIRTIAFLTGGLNFVGSAGTLCMLLLARQRGADAEAIGLMFSVAAVGGVVGAVIAGPLARRLSFAQAILATVWSGVVLFPLVLVMPTVWLIGALTAAMFMTTPLYNVVQFSYRLALIPDQLQGRVNSAFRLIAWGSQPLGAAAAGVLLEAVGVTATILAFSAVFVVIGVAAAASREIRTAKPIAEGQALGGGAGAGDGGREGEGGGAVA
jgi:MFS family permease